MVRDSDVAFPSAVAVVAVVLRVAPLPFSSPARERSISSTRSGGAVGKRPTDCARLDRAARQSSSTLATSTCRSWTDENSSS